jgi:hypothetical protein
MAAEAVNIIVNGSNMDRDGVYLSPKIALHDYRSANQGRGLIATENISVPPYLEFL